MMKNQEKLVAEDFANIHTNEELLALIKDKNVHFNKVKSTLSYNEELRLLQIELVKLQRQWVLNE